ncbi:hypothetical protein [Streptomyces sviceus]|uniref:hypothetical protein n=1 Tax=Streptomyces sviceus TaxID=285530 RepID=UPI0036EAC72B
MTRRTGASRSTRPTRVAARAQAPAITPAALTSSCTEAPGGGSFGLQIAAAVGARAAATAGAVDLR